MLLDIAIADAYGAGFEFAKTSVLENRPNDFTRFYTHNLDANNPGTYTDDTQMSLALANWMLEPNFSLLQPDEVLRKAIAHSFVETFHRDPRQAYSKRLFQFLKNSHNGDSFLSSIDSSSTRSGAAMRSAILAFLPCLDDVLRIAPLQASITHNTPEGKATSTAVAVAAWCHRHGAALEYSLKQGVQRAVQVYKNNGGMQPATVQRLGKMAIAKEGVSVQGIDSVNAAFHALGKEKYGVCPSHCEGDSTKPMSIMLTTGTISHAQEGCVRALLQRIVSWGGDTDTVCAIAMGIYAAGQKPMWPQWCLQNFENGVYGREYLQETDKKLNAKYPVLHQ